LSFTLQQLLACHTGAHCATCRDHDGGRDFRASACAKASDAPADAPDFACLLPKTKPWGWTPGMTIQRPPEPIPDDYDPETERRRMRQGGCCGKPSRDA
jgi:hypothetical protein